MNIYIINFPDNCFSASHTRSCIASRMNEQIQECRLHLMKASLHKNVLLCMHRFLEKTHT